MYRIHTRPKGAPINDPRIGQPFWSKPGTPLDRIVKVHGRAIRGLKRPVMPVKSHQRRREVERNMRRLPDDGHGRVLVASATTGLAMNFNG